jgi:hypothetical protein
MQKKAKRNRNCVECGLVRERIREDGKGREEMGRDN